MVLSRKARELEQIRSGWDPLGTQSKLRGLPAPTKPTINPEDDEPPQLNQEASAPAAIPPTQTIFELPNTVAHSIDTASQPSLPQDVAPLGSPDYAVSDPSNHGTQEKLNHRKEANRRITEYQRRRYRNDPEYRESRRAKARKYYRATHGVTEVVEPAVPPQDGSLSLSETMTQLGISEATARRWIKSGKLTAYRWSTPQGYEWRILLSPPMDSQSPSSAQP